MLEIQEKFTTEGYESVVEAAGDVQLHITEAYDKGEVTGFIAYSYEDDHTVVYDYDDGGDLYLCDGLVRSVLFKSCLKGIGKAVFRISDKKKYENLKRLRFVTDESYELEKLDDFMNSCKGCKGNHPANEN